MVDFHVKRLDFNWQDGTCYLRPEVDCFSMELQEFHPWLMVMSSYYYPVENSAIMKQ